MKEPNRWLLDDGAPEGVREMLRAGDPTPVVSPAVRAELGAFAQGLAAKSAIAAVTGSIVATKVILGGAVLGMAVAATVVSVAVLAPPRPAASVGSPSLSAPTLPTPPTRGAAADEASRGEPAASVEQGEPRGPSPVLHDQRAVVPNDTAPTARGNAEPSIATSAAPGGPAVAAFGVAGIADEAALLERARSALGSSPAIALSLTEEHRSAFPSGQLSAERELVAIDALERLGRSAEARRRAAPLLAAPNGPYARRVRRILGDAK
ncbi:MAG: hypothetical protein JW751_12425 [Polyangiaceae bacterium]|nr:hypothetical protein [Polyangiaceae bacterium]